MCGIIYTKNLVDSVPVNNTVKMLYLAQKDRGYEGFGFVGMTKDVIQEYKSENEAGILKFLDKNKFDEILYHHRFPTSTKNTCKTAHPFVMEWEGKTFYFVHNGVITNAFKLEKEHIKLGIKYTSKDEKKGTFNDSEALGWDFVLTLCGKQKKSKAVGSCSFICLEVGGKEERANKLYFYTNGDSPLKMYRDAVVLTISSETGAEDVEVDVVFAFDYKSRKIAKVRGIDYKVGHYSYYGTSLANGGYGLTGKGMSEEEWDDYCGYNGKYNTITADELDDLEDNIDKLEGEIKKLRYAVSECVRTGDVAQADVLEDIIIDKENELDKLEEKWYTYCGEEG